MVYKGKYKIIDNYITACDYDFLLKRIEESISKKRSLLISPIASHTLVRAHYDKNLKKILDKFGYLVPDSQWVRWSIPFLYGRAKRLVDRVYGPELMLRTLKLSKKKSYKIFFYGNTKKVLKKLQTKLIKKIPHLKIIGEEESEFRELTEKEWKDLVKKIEKLNTNIFFVSLGSPKQEIFSYKLAKKMKKPLIIIPVGAAFDFISKSKPQAPKYMQNIGLEWLFRLLNEPERLSARYLFYGLFFTVLIFVQKIVKFNYRE